MFLRLNTFLQILLRKSMKLKHEVSVKTPCWGSFYTLVINIFTKK